MSASTGLDFKIRQMALRIRELREIEGLSEEQMALKTGVSVEEYRACEKGDRDLNFAFLYRCASAFNVDVTDIIEGTSPNLSGYTLTRRGDGQRIEKAHGMTYFNLAHAFKNRIAEPLFVQAVYSPDEKIEVTSHDGQECDIVIKGSLKVRVGDHIEVLHEGDSIYYDSSKPHGMAAVGGEDCLFYAIVLNPSGEPIPELVPEKPEPTQIPRRLGKESKDRIYKQWTKVVKNENGTPVSVEFLHPDDFNFAFDVVDELARTKPEKLAMLHLDKNKTERRFTFRDISRESARAANYFASLGIQKGDRVMLVLKRHYQFWFAMLGLNKLGAIAIPATNQLTEHDFTYRFEKAGVKAVVCTADGETAHEVEKAKADCGLPELLIMAGGEREGWLNFDSGYASFPDTFPRTADSPKGEDLMIMFFSSGTTGYPKIAAHNHKYPFGHFITAKYWHCVDPDGLHLTISDTGWAKAMWGKLYGQWFCEAATFVYDFDRFKAADILPLFAQYHITTFCAPPTMYRMLIKEDLTKYDLSSVEHATIAGEALNPEVFKQLEKLTGLQVMEGFGQSESTLMIGNLVGDSHKIGSMGKPVPGYDIDIVDRDGKSVDVGETGEIVVRAPRDPGRPCGLFVEYYRDPEKTEEAWHDGLYHTGDVAWRDEDGFYWYVGRTDDLIKSSGYRIGPFEIENVIMELPYVLECGVSAAPDEIRGQVVKASIVLTKGTEGTEELKKEIQNYVKSKTAPYKYPRIVVFRDKLPKTVSGKIIRSML